MLDALVLGCRFSVPVERFPATASRGEGFEASLLLGLSTVRMRNSCRHLGHPSFWGWGTPSQKLGQYALLAGLNPVLGVQLCPWSLALSCVL